MFSQKMHFSHPAANIKDKDVIKLTFSGFNFATPRRIHVKQGIKFKLSPTISSSASILINRFNKKRLKITRKTRVVVLKTVTHKVRLLDLRRCHFIFFLKDKY